jgi:hypothetical protein
MDPATYAKVGTEHAHQVAVFIWASRLLKKYPMLEWLYAVPNGGERNRAVAARLKAEGVKSGVSDLCLPYRAKGYSGLYIEMKKPGGKESKEQKEFGAFVSTQRFLYRCCTSWDEAVETIAWYLDIPETDW